MDALARSVVVTLGPKGRKVIFEKSKWVRWEDAAQQAVAKASQTLHNFRPIYIKDHSATVENGKLVKVLMILALLVLVIFEMRVLLFFVTRD